MNKRPFALLLLAVALLPCARVEGAVYTIMDNDRILLMNNDNKALAKVTSQGYYDTNTTGKTYWMHSTETPSLFSRALLAGITHTMYKNDGTRLWHLEQCRAGSGTMIASNRNYIPWTTTAVSIQDGTTTQIPVTSAGSAMVGSVIMRNSDEACVYSPLYREGIGTIYFDAVNAFVNDLTAPEIALEIATDVTQEAASSGKTFEGIVDEYDSLRWRPCPFDVFMVNSSTELTPLENGATNLVLAVTAGGSEQFYRVRTHLNYYSPIRFRIRRLNHSEGRNPDTTGLALIDNIIASYPPMTAELRRYGKDYDASLKGAEVMGCIGDFTQPFLAYKSNHVFPHAWLNLVTNSASDLAAKVTDSRFIYRWRYLNQIVGDWKTIAFDQDTVSSDSFSTSNLVGKVAIPLTDGVGDVEYYFAAEIDAPYYLVQDYACSVGYGIGWTEKIAAITNRATYAATDNLPSMGVDYFTRIREGESNVEWVQLVGTLTITNEVAGSNEVVRLLTPDGAAPRMTLEGDHSWRYHYAVPANAIGGTLSFKLVAKEYYANETAATSSATPAVVTWYVRTNELYTVENAITAIPYTATLAPSNPNEISLILDDSSTHLKIEYNDERNTLSLTHASYQWFNLWTDATDGFRGNRMDDNGVSNSGVSNDKKRYDAPFDGGWEICPEDKPLWHVDFNSPDLNGWTARNASFVAASRDDDSNLALALEGRGRGGVGLEQFPEQELPRGIDAVSFNARISQPIEFEDFATYSDGVRFSNYAISSKITMSRQKETSTVKPTDMSPVHPSVSFVGYYRDKQGCYEFRMTRTSETELTLALYKWMTSGSSTKPTLLTSKIYTSNLLVPTSDEEVRGDWRTAAYLLVYTLSDGKVKLEGHLSSERTAVGIGVSSTDTGLSASAISYVDEYPGVLARGGSYGVGSADCRAGFGAIKTHEVVTAPTEDIAPAGDAQINWSGTFVGLDQLGDEWDFHPSRWEVDSRNYSLNGGLSAVIPNQDVQLWVADATENGSAWFPSGYEVVVNSFSANRFTISPHMPGTWKVMLKTGEEGAASVVIDNVDITPWEGVERWGRTGSVFDYSHDWVYTKGWITEKTENVRVCTFQPSRGVADYPMGLRSPFINRGLSNFSYSYENADSNCVMLVQIATNMTPGMGSSYVPGLTDSLATTGGYGWTTIARHEFRMMTDEERKSGTRTTFFSARQHWTHDFMSSKDVYTNVCGVIRVIVDPAVVSHVVNTTGVAAREKMIDYGKITLTGAFCYDEPPLNLRSWFGWNVHTEGWDGSGNAGPFANLTDQPNGLSIALNFSAVYGDNRHPDAKGIGLGEPAKENEYREQNPFIQCAELTNGIGTVSFRARLFDTSKDSAVVTLYGGVDPSIDQPTTESYTWDVLTNFVVTAPTYQVFEWTFSGAKSEYRAIRLEAAGARWGRYPSGRAVWWEWGALDVKQEPINRVFIDDMSVGEPVVPVVDVSMINASVGGKLVSVPVEWLAEVTGWPVEQIRVQLDGARSILEEPGRAANGRLSLAECYVLGIDPNDPDQDFVITEFPLKADGTPDLANIKFEPSPEKWNIKDLTFKLKGAANLAGEWQDVPDCGNPMLRFFKVEVILP